MVSFSYWRFRGDVCGPVVDSENLGDQRFIVGLRNGWCRPHASHALPRRVGLRLSWFPSINSCRHRVAATFLFLTKENQGKLLTSGLPRVIETH